MVVAKNPSFSRKQDISEFISAFLDELEPYTKMKQSMEDFNTVLDTKNNDSKYKYKPKVRTFDQDRSNDKKGNYIKQERFRLLPEHTNEIDYVIHEDVNVFTPNDNGLDMFDEEEGLGTIAKDQEASLVGDLDDFEEDMLAAFDSRTPNRENSNYVEGCFYEYRNGVCTKEADGTCKLDHSKEGMIKAH